MDLPQATVTQIMTRQFLLLDRSRWPRELTYDKARIALLIDRERLAGAAFPEHLAKWMTSYPGEGPDRFAWFAVKEIPAKTLVTDAVPQMGGHVTVVVDEDRSPVGVLLWTDVAWFLVSEYLKLQTRFHTALNTLEESVSMVNEDGMVIAWNRAAQRLFSIDPSAILGRPLAEFFPFKDQWSLQALKTGKTVHQALHEPHPGTWVIINSSPVRLGDRIIGALAVEQNITNMIHLNEQLYRTTSEVKALQGMVASLRQHDDPFTAIRGQGKAIQAAVALARKVASSDATVLIRGESGVGKELFAKAIHNTSERRDLPFVAINCGAIPAALFESELFGYERGAFTGADQKGKAGKLEQAQGGTLFLDEVGELPPEAQVKLLRVLQDRRFYRLGSDKPRQADVRIIAATNANLEEMLRRGAFREDLYFRLDVVSIELPPLRARSEDMAELVHDFAQEFALRYRRPIQAIEPEVMLTLMNHSWPGNVRELRNVMERLVVLADDGMILAENLPQAMRRLAGTVSSIGPAGPTTRAWTFAPQDQDRHAPGPESRAASDAVTAAGPLLEFKSLPDAAREARRRAILEALEAAGHNRSKAAKLLGISRSTLYYQLKQLNLV